MRGITVDDYEVWGQLSQGGMSDVWLARQRELALPVILKTLHPIPGEPASERYRRLLSEARLMARVGSPRVVRVLDVGREPSLASPFLVEEYVDGLDLGELDRRRREVLRRPLPVWAVARMVAQAAEGLHAAHQAGVLHCDVKPSNLFRDSRGDVKVGDFGIAGSTCSLADRIPAGTPGFMAPEQLLGGELDRRADVYALGATAYALRYGEPPNGRLPEPRTPDEAFFQHLVLRMLATARDARPANMAVIARRFRELARVPRLAVAACDTAFTIGATRIVFEVGDISTAHADAIVNSANSALAMTSGVGGALKSAGGDAIEREAREHGERALGDCVHTGAGRLACRGVLHAVGGWNEVSCVSRAMHRAMLLAEEHGYRRIAVPAIGTGQGRVSLESSADALVSTLLDHLALGGSRLAEVRFVLAGSEALRRFVDVARATLLDADPDAADPDADAACPDVAALGEAESAPTQFASSAIVARAS